MAKYQKKLEEDIRCPLEYGLTRVLDDTEMLAQVHYVLVNPDYQGMGIAGKMIEYIKEKYKDFMYIEGMPEDKNNMLFYKKNGFTLMENGIAMQICNDIHE